LRKRATQFDLLVVFLSVRADKRDAFEIIEKDIEGLLEAAGENVLEDKSFSNLHILIEYTNIAPADILKIRRWLIERGKEFHKDVRAYLTEFEQDLGTGAGSAELGKVLLGSYAYTAPFEDDVGDGSVD